MLVDNVCNICGEWYDGHWIEIEGKLVINVPCPKCGSLDVNSHTDEAACDFADYKESFRGDYI